MACYYLSTSIRIRLLLTTFVVGDPMGADLFECTLDVCLGLWVLSLVYQIGITGKIHLHKLTDINYLYIRTYMLKMYV